jgi:tRNA (cytidine/uridine-2'-O-)-methyltransferase
MLNIVLYQPEIPPNTGNIIRLASNTGCKLHLVKPLGFGLEDRDLRRAGLDYHEYCELQVHENWEEFLKLAGASRVWAFSTKGRSTPAEVAFAAGDYLLFGPESRGLPGEILQDAQLAGVLRLPMLAHSRSLNLSNAVAVAVYEGWRQLGFAGAAEGTQAGT